MANANTPCKDCSDRHYGCHSECDKYKAYSESRKAVLEKRRKAWEIEKGIAEHFVRLGNRRKQGKAMCRLSLFHKR